MVYGWPASKVSGVVDGAKVTVYLKTDAGPSVRNCASAPATGPGGTNDGSQADARNHAPHRPVRSASRAWSEARSVRRVRNARFLRRHLARARCGAPPRGTVRSFAHGTVRIARRERRRVGRNADRQSRRKHEAGPSTL